MIVFGLLLAFAGSRWIKEVFAVLVALFTTGFGLLVAKTMIDPVSENAMRNLIIALVVSFVAGIGVAFLAYKSL